MDRIVWLTFQVLAWIVFLLLIFYILFLVKNRRSEHVLLLLGSLVRGRNERKRKKQFIDRMYVRDSSDRFTAGLYIIILFFIFFIVMNNYVTFVVVTSESMTPTFNKGDMVLVQSFETTPATGEIIQFRVPGRRLPVLHRVAKVSDVGYITQGDVNPIPDDWIVSKSQIQAKAVNLLGRWIVIPEVGELFIAERRITKFGDEFNFISGVVNIFKIFAFIMFILALLSLFEIAFRRPR